MKIKDEFMLREISGDYVVIPTGKAVLNLNALITLNESGVLLWKLLQEGSTEEKMTQALLDEYETDRKTAEEDVKKFVANLSEFNIL